MLVLSRKAGQKIHIGDSIAVTVLDVSGRIVRLGIDAPSNVTILRGDIKEQVENENRLAAENVHRLGGLSSIVSALSRSRRKPDSK